MARDSSTDLNATIGANLRALREFNGETQGALAALLGITFQQWQKYERGQNRLSAERLHRLREHFQVPYDYFFHGAGETSLPEMEILIKSDPVAIEVFHLVRQHRNTADKAKILDIIRILTR